MILLSEKKLGIVLIMLGIAVTFAKDIVPVNLVIYTLSLPASMLLILLGISIVMFGKALPLRDTVVWFAELLRFDKLSTRRKNRILSFISRTVQSERFPDDQESYEITARSLKRMGTDDVSVETLMVILKDPALRREFSLKAGLRLEEIDEVYFSELAPTREMTETLFRRAADVRAFQKRIYLFVAILLPVAIFFGVISSLNRTYTVQVSNYYLSQQFISLMDNLSLNATDYDVVAEFLDATSTIPLTKELRSARDILGLVYSHRDSINAGWAKAYYFIIREHESDKSVDLAQSILDDDIWDRITSFVVGDSHVSRTKVKAYVDILKGFVCLRYTSYDAYDVIATIRARRFFSNALKQQPRLDIAHTGIATSLEYEIMSRDLQGDSVLAFIYSANAHLDSANASNQGNFFKRAQYFNNKANLFLHIAKLMKNYPRAHQPERRIPRQCEQFWHEIGALLIDSTLPIFDTISIFLTNVTYHYPADNATFALTRAQFHSLKAMYLADIGKEAEALKELELSLHIIGSAMRLGFGSPEIFYRSNRARFYFDTFDWVWAADLKNKLVTIMTTYFPNVRSLF